MGIIMTINEKISKLKDIFEELETYDLSINDLKKLESKFDKIITELKTYEKTLYHERINIIYDTYFR